MHQPHPHPGPPLEGEGVKQGKGASPPGTGHGEVLRLRDIAFADAAALLARYDLHLERVPDGEAIPGSYWGECEAGVIGSTVYVRGDTPVHSLLHEACHLIVLPPERRAVVHTDATDSVEEEDAVCLLQALLGDTLPGVGRVRVLADMDAWGYTFRLGSAAAYFERDADAAWAWLVAHGLVDSDRGLRLPG
ncbi:hypothetical protein ACTJIL_02515 [Luteimonas sp. 22616]|uniref:hypothetical protein n=1 Tax=Luteimonas sp. 22616 TaxID=3453951 RepID=UPI003F87B1D9